MAAAAAAVIVVPAGLRCSTSSGSWDKKSANICKSAAFHGTGSGSNSALLALARGIRKSGASRSRSALLVRAAKLPAGVEAPKEEPKLPVSLWGFTEKAEVWNSRAAMIGLFALIGLEFVAHKGILQIIGVDIGKGLDLPL